LAAGHVTVTVPSLFAVAVTVSGASGTADVGTTGLDAFFGPDPLALTAYTVNTYCWPLVSPVMSSARWVLPTSRGGLPSPSTTYLVIGAPFGLAGPQVRCTVVLPAVATTLVGALGGPTGGGCFGGCGGGLGGGSPPRMLLAYLSTTLTWPLSSTTRALDEFGALTKRWLPRTLSSSLPPALGIVIVSTSLPSLSRT